MTHFFLSPHPDDAVLSCGGQIATLVGQGERVMIITIMAGDPPAGFKPNEFVDELWERWEIGQGQSATSARRNEDRAAAAVLGAEVAFWPLPEAIYRLSDTGESLYPDRAAIFGEVQNADPIIQAINGKQIIYDFAWQILESGIIHAPLGVGNHVDHQLTRKIAQVLFGGCSADRLVYYEEFPYSEKGSEIIDLALTGALADPNASVPLLPKPILHLIDAGALDVKIQAIACYRSQISSFWPDLDEMAQRIREYTEFVGGEREWLLVPQQET